MTSGGRLAQRVALVTGGGGEIGGAICRRFAAEGAEVAIADLDPAKSAAVARAIAGSGGLALALEVDVADEAPLRASEGSPRWSMSPPPSRPTARSRRFRSMTGTRPSRSISPAPS